MSEQISVGINGFGRVGKLVGREMLDDPRFNLVAVNKTTPLTPEQLAIALENDKVHGPWGVGHSIVRVQHPKPLEVDGMPIRTFSQRDPANIAWGELAPKLAVVEATGKFLTTEEAKRHIAAGAAQVIMTAAAKSPEIPTIVMGVTDDRATIERAGNDQMVAVSSCSTNAIGPILAVLGNELGFKEAHAVIDHAFTTSQGPDEKRDRFLYRTGSAEEIVRLLPGVDFSVECFRDRSLTNSRTGLAVPRGVGGASVDDVYQALQGAADGAYSDIIELNPGPVTDDMVTNNPHSSVIDLSTLRAADGNIMFDAWYDNEFGYAQRVVDVTALMAA